jgi:8-amino-7-oxononanoate synthase
MLKMEGALDFTSKELLSLKRHGLYRSLKALASACEPKVELDGREMVQFASNSYLGLSTHPRVKAAAIRAVEKYGTGAGASRLLVGNSDLHLQLEEALALFKGTEGALVYATGSMANMGVLPCLVGPRDLVLLDELAHASLHDGARLSRARLESFKHNDLADLESKLAGLGGKGRVLVAVEGFYSMDGDLAPLPELSRLCRKTDAMLLVDEAHATGVLGKTGRGSLEHFDLPPSAVDIQIGTLSKALASLGGFAACSKELRELLINKSRSFIFATALPPASAGAALESLKVIGDEPQILRKLWDNVRGLAEFLGMPAKGPIFPVIVGTAERAIELQDALWQKGMYVPAIRPPTVPRNKSRLRISLMATHTTEQIEGLAGALKASGSK